ncbi:MAG TPA: hypothetical protein VFX30_07455 [bacterium]|nr:hypothetical protein [bacterium]
MSPPASPDPTPNNDGHHFRLMIGYSPSFLSTRLRLQAEDRAAPDYAFHMLDAHVGWQYLSQYVDFNLAARLGVNFYNPTDSASSSSPGFTTFEPGVYASIHGRPARWIGIGVGIFAGPQIWTGHADVGSSSTWNFDPNVTAMIAPELTVRFYPIGGLSIEAGMRAAFTPDGFSAPTPRNPDARITPSVGTVGALIRAGYSF